MPFTAEKSPAARPANEIYSEQVRRLDVLGREEEATLGRRARDGDREAFKALVSGHVRFIQKVAHRYDGYGMDYDELVQEGNVGLCQAAQKFDPDRGFRLISYAIWYIDAAMRNYVLKNWSLVKVATTNAQRKMFFRLRAETAALLLAYGGDEAAAGRALQEFFGVSEDGLADMRSRLSGRDHSVNGTMAGHRATTTEEHDSASDTWEDRLTDPEAQDALQVAEAAQHQANLVGVMEALARTLSPREQVILAKRFLLDEPLTRTETGKAIGISRERVRQLEAGIRGRVEDALLSARMQGLV